MGQPEPAGDPTDALRSIYQRFATVEASRRSPIYAELAEHVSRDDATLALLRRFPPAKRQPNLLFAAVQYVAGPLTGIAAFADAMAECATEIVDVVRRRSTQTNIPARCATLLPALAQLPQPLALLEVGASAGLCLYPDCYAYDYDGTRVPARINGGPTFRCSVRGAVPIPREPVEVVWRAGLDLNPLDINDSDDRAWLEALVWPGEENKLDQLRAATEIATKNPPILATGDLAQDLAPIANQAPDNATLVVFHTAVLAYVREPEHRERFADNVRALGATWLANEVPERIPGLSPAALTDHPAGEFLLCENAAPLARTDPHGTAISWVAS
ncbi:DUF2332 domain-containing protein [Pseudonocardia sp. RS010]|uniref:DUF2332 domain-containing protein n=1 Tax=Pseudonocardia sp. RS010 TaxID=3385979 RepID=UPI0039A2B778